MALAYLKRIDRLLSLCDLHSMQGDIDGWNRDLTSLYRELSIKLKDDEEKELIGEEKTNIDLKDANSLDNISAKHATMNNINVLCNSPVHCTTHKKHILFLLHNLEIKMRRKMQKRGMLLPSKDDPWAAITQR